MSDPDVQETPDETPEDARCALEQLEERLASSLMHAAEVIAPEGSHSPGANALPDTDQDAPFVAEFDFLAPILAQIRRAIADNPDLAELLHRLPQGLGAGEALPVLFANLWPEQRERYKVFLSKCGERILTQKQVAQRLEVIRDKLNATPDQEAAAVAVSMGYLQMDVMDLLRL